MTTPVLATKFFVPSPRATAVARPALVGRLQAGLASGRRLTLVCAPAGFGKTSLLSEWIVAVRQENPAVGVAWLSLDEADNDESRFLEYLVAALRTADPAIGAGLPAALTMESALTTVLNDVANTARPMILVLDDVQAVEQAVFREALGFLLEHAPSNLHLVLGSRSDPELPLARLRSQGQLTELRAIDLRFSSAEAERFLNEVMGLSLPAQAVAALGSRTEGWIAGLQLAALSIREREDVAGFIDAFTGSHRFVIDYLGEEVLQRQPIEVRRFLMETAFLDRLTGELCDAVTGRGDSAEILERLERENLFVVPLDDQRQWYRYHHLFADVLRTRSQREDRDRVPRLHRQASEWYEQGNHLEEAIKHALSASDFERAARLIERAIPDARRRRQDSTFLAWLALLPDGIAEDMPVLGVYYAWAALMAGDLDQVESRLADAERALSTPGHGSVSGEELTMLPASIAVHRASVAQARGDIAATAEHARHALELTVPGGNHLARATAAGLLAMALWAEGDVTAAVETFTQARASLRLAGHTADLMASTVVLADMLLVQGRTLQAMQAYERALLPDAGLGEVAAASVADLHVGLSEVLLERGDIGGAIAHLASAAPPDDGLLVPGNRYRWFVARARVRLAEGETDAALELLHEAERHFAPGPVPDTRPVAGMMARIRIDQGRLADALAWIETQGVDAADEVSYAREYGLITLALLRVAEYRVGGRPEQIREAADLLERLLDAAQAGGRTGSANEILRIQASVLEAQGRRPIVPGGDAPTLSDRELAVLRLLTTELTGPQIARELFVTLNTLRTHTKHIFGKLDVNSRSAAVRRAGEHGLL